MSVSIRARMCRRAAFTALILAAPLRAELTLPEAERGALGDEPGLQALRHKAAALDHRAVADGELPDPRLKLGLMNLPTDGFAFDQEPMTQVQIGVQQAFPAGDTLEHRARRTRRLADAERAGASEREREILREVRRAWLETWYWVQAGRVVDESKGLFEQLVNVTRSRYAAGGQNQQDVIQAELELELLEDRTIRIRTREEQARAELGRWIGPERAAQDLPAELPALAEPRDPGTALERHPVIRAESARVSAGNQAVAMAREAFKPKWMVDVTYGIRSGETTPAGPSELERGLSAARQAFGLPQLSGGPGFNAYRDAVLAPSPRERPDFFSLMLMVDVPLFPGDRQSRRLEASREEVDAALQTRERRMRELRRMLDDDHAAWVRTGERLARYREVLLPRARENAEAALNAYQSERGDFTALMRARISELDTRLQALRLGVDRAKAQAGLLYLAGESR